MAKGGPDPTSLSSGVDSLIAQLRQDGIDAGRAEAERILADARAQAKAIQDKAEAEARARVEQARREADSFRKAGEEALRTAMRDTVLDMKATLTQRFASDLKRLVSQQMHDPEVLRRMIVAVAGRAGAQAELAEGEPVEVLLPKEIVGLDALRNNPDSLREGPITQTVLGLTGEMLRAGVRFGQGDEGAGVAPERGILVKLDARDITLDLSDQAVAAVLLQHLQPRFRAILEGIVK
ncbi:hypothetical protein AY600_02235 [Phormidium willei BDU 130791]|nr:hypothetical protein AY600_02235 [Phormidium willei BDU 130791]